MQYYKSSYKDMQGGTPYWMSKLEEIIEQAREKSIKQSYEATRSHAIYKT